MWIIPSNHPLRQSLSVRAFAESKEELNELSDLHTSLMWRSKPLSLKIWSRKWSAVYWIRLLFGRTLKHSHANHFEESLTSYLRATHASHFQLRESEKEPKIPGIYTPTLKGQFGLFDHGSASLKTSEDTSHAASLKSSPRWRDWVIECTGEYTRRRKQARRTKGKEYSSWLTPRAQESGEGKETFIKRMGDRSGNCHSSLKAQVTSWPTPTAMNPNETEDPTQWRDRRAKIKAKKINGNGFGMPLGQAVKQWPTPMNNDCKRSGTTENRLKRNTLELPEAMYRDPASLNRHGNIRGSYPERLNPLWVCQLMGITFEKTFFVHLETPSMKIPPNSHSETLSENII